MATIREAAERLKKNTEKGEKLSEKFEEVKSIEKDSEVRESFLSQGIEERKPGKVAGVDGGLLKKRYSSGDLVSVRAVSAVLDFTNKDISADYIPSKSPEPEFHVFEQGDRDGLNERAEAERLKAETEVALNSLEEAETVLMDGSIVPSYLEDEEALERYKELFDKADLGSLAGVVEDSYGLKMAELLEDKLGVEIGRVRDTMLMDAVLDPGERSFVRKYSDSPVEHPVLRNLEDSEANRIKTFYVRLSDKDLPLRVDFYGSKDDADEIAGKLLYMKSSDSYTVPSPIVEADKRAKIPKKYVSRLEKRFSPGVKRRERRRF